MTAFPDVPPTRKPTQWKIIIPVVILLVLCCLCLVIVGIFAYLGTQGTGPLSMLATDTSTPTLTPTSTPTRTPTRTATRTATRTSTRTLPAITGSSIVGDWDIYFDWDCSGGDYASGTMTFFNDYTYWVNEDDTLWGTWFTVGDYVDFTFNEYPNSHYIGTLDYSGTYMEGTMDNLDNMTGCWYALKTSSPTTVLSIEGDWDLYYDWECDGSFDDPVFLSFYSDETFWSGGDLRGTWYTSGDYVDFIFDTSPYAHYTGTLDSSSTFMEGTMETNDAYSGCWYATR